MRRISVWLPVHKFPHQISVCTSPPFYGFWFTPLYNIQSAVQIMKLPTMQSSALHCYAIPLGLKYPPQHHILKHPRFMFLSQCETPNIIPNKRAGKIVVLYILTLVDKNYCKKCHEALGENFRVLRCSNRSEVTEECDLGLSVLLDMWNIAGTSVW